MDYAVHGILQTRILEWIAFPFSRGSSQPRDRTQVSRIAGRFFTSWATREAHAYLRKPPWPSPHQSGVWSTSLLLNAWRCLGGARKLHAPSHVFCPMHLFHLDVHLYPWNKLWIVSVFLSSVNCSSKWQSGELWFIASQLEAQVAAWTSDWHFKWGQSCGTESKVNLWGLTLSRWMV